MVESSTTSVGSWSETDSAEFLDAGRYFVPAREAQIATLCRLAGFGPGEGDFVELCSGPGILSQALLEHYPTRRVHAFDGSPRMIEEASTLLAPYGERFDVRQFDLAERSWRRFPWPVAAVVSSLAVHHLDGAQKKELFNDLAGALLPGGALILADIVRPAGQPGTVVAAEAWDEAVRQRSLELDGDLRGFERFQALNWNTFKDLDADPADKPSLLLDQLLWMKEAGFTEVDVFWMCAGHAIYGGRKSL